jgi:phospholipase D1/2
VQHFCERWNFVGNKGRCIADSTGQEAQVRDIRMMASNHRYQHNHRMEWLQLPDREWSPNVQANLAAWNDVRSQKEAEKEAERQKFRDDHPHLSEWRDVSCGPVYR